MKKITVTLALLVALLSTACLSLFGPSQAERRAEADRLIKNGNGFVWEGDRDRAEGNYDRAKSNYDRAIDLFSSAIKHDPSYAKAYDNRGKEYLKKGDYDPAIADFTEVIRLEESSDPRSISSTASAYNSRGRAYFLKGDYDKAIEDHSEAIKIYSSDNRQKDTASVYNDRGAAYFNKGDYDKAIEDYTAAISRGDGYNSRMHRARAYFAKNDYDRAIEEYTSIITDYRSPDGAYYNRGNVYYTKGDYNRAIADYTRAIDLNLRADGAYYNRGRAYASKGDYEKALADYEAVLRIKSDHDDAKDELEYVRPLVAESRRLAAEQRAQTAAERAEAQRLTNERLQRIIRLDGAYVSTGGTGNWNALRFMKADNGNIDAHTIYDEGRRLRPVGVTLDGSTVRIYGTPFTALSNGNLQNQAGGIFTFVPFSGVAGKTYSSVVAGGDTLGFSRDSRYIVESRGRVTDNRTYEYDNKEGTITIIQQGQSIGRLYDFGTHLVRYGGSAPSIFELNP